MLGYFSFLPDCVVACESVVSMIFSWKNGPGLKYLSLNV